MRIATWNVNSLRARADRVEEFLERQDVDVLAIQETKCKDENFPWEVFEHNGYDVAHFGYDQWNGVAIASRVGMKGVERTFPDQPPFGKAGKDPVQEARAIAATCGDVRVWSLYVPNGRSRDDEHMTYKLGWLDRLRDHAEAWLTETPDAQIVLAGDWNVAPEDEDVWDIDFFEKNRLTHVTDEERAAFQGFLDAGYADVARPYTPGPGAYTFWDYTSLRFQKRQGMRIDFLLASPALADRAADAFIDKDERRGKGASDHAPVIADFS
ncbi:exodeoxyribonuclease III [Nesterenkonia sp. NBAIMH1]|uniref:exodeoxyribonuclease III n=1 Tax=Nesterenkonia sp. NBAIMH1 TaxID=2600320 RepID=UPI0011B7D355|nr:exodeoxyribonuclease III [Nesterenkonia sp. NBAIMH1]